MSKVSEAKEKLNCGETTKSWRKNKKRAVKACKDGKEKIVHYGHTDYDHNYSKEAKKNFRARHNCDNAKDVFSARYHACKDLWSKSVKAGKGAKKDKKSV